MNGVMSCHLVTETKRTRRPRRKQVEDTTTKMFRLRRAINDMIPDEKFEYRNMVIADAIAKGHGNDLNEEWLHIAMAGDIRDGFYSNEDADATRDKYLKAIEELKRLA